MPRLVRVALVAFAATAAGCFALFPLDDYGPGSADAAPIDAAASSEAAVVDPTARHVFITSAMIDGKIELDGGADEQCQTLATAAGLAGTYRAWLSTSSSSVAERFGFLEAGVPAVHFVDMTGRVVASSWDAIFSRARPDFAIEYTENGAKVGPDHDASTGSCEGVYTAVWTNTEADAAYDGLGSGCADYQTNDSKIHGRIGIVSAQPETWTRACELPCNLKARLYCFEQ